MTKPLLHHEQIPGIMTSLGEIHAQIEGLGLNNQLIHLVLLLASQINGCAYCVKMHTEEAKRDGETPERLERLTVWRRVPDYTEAEKAAFEWTETLTTINKSAYHHEKREALRAHFTDRQISVLTALIGMINMWNRFQISTY